MDYEAYAEARAEARACGQEFPTFEEWSGKVSPREQAEERHRQLEQNDELDLY